MTLQVESLEASRYELLIDAKPIAEFTREELQHGVNLALYKTPMGDQARGIDGNEEDRNTLDQARFTLSVKDKGNSISALAEARLRQTEDEIAAAIRTDLDPKPHSFELRRK
jgi:hypothetical protein